MGISIPLTEVHPSQTPSPRILNLGAFC